jgi:hypothetical protein
MRCFQIREKCFLHLARIGRKKRLDALALAATGKKAERTLRIEIDEETFERLYVTVARPIRVKRPGQIPRCPHPHFASGRG